MIDAQLNNNAAKSLASLEPQNSNFDVIAALEENVMFSPNDKSSAKAVPQGPYANNPAFPRTRTEEKIMVERRHVGRQKRQNLESTQYQQLLKQYNQHMEIQASGRHEQSSSLRKIFVS